MTKKIGIRIEDKYAAERRVAITPFHAKKLIDEYGIEVQFLPSKKRIFTDDEFIAAGCKKVDSLSEPNIIFGVKEIPYDFFEKGKTYLFFSHTIKGQPYNMGMLRKMMETQCNLIDYERVVDENNRRLIFFGRYAGIAGMIDTLWSLGRRLKEKNIETCLLKIKHACDYSSVEEAKSVIREVAEDIRKNGFPTTISPIVIGVTGYGNVAKGTSEITDLLPIKEITPKELLTLRKQKTDNHLFYKVVFKEEDLYKRKDGSDFNLTHFYQNPKLYEAQFEQYVSHLTVLLNCIYWNPESERILTKNYLKKKWRNNDFHLTVISDITCDPNGSIESTHDGTPIENPVFVYHPDTEEPTFGFKGEGILTMAVDILPSELPRESSMGFADALTPFVNAIVTCDFSVPFEQLSLPLPIKRALILHNGKLTPSYEYLSKFVVNQ